MGRSEYIPSAEGYILKAPSPPSASYSSDTSSFSHSQSQCQSLPILSLPTLSLPSLLQPQPSYSLQFCKSRGNEPVKADLCLEAGCRERERTRRNSLPLHHGQKGPCTHPSGWACPVHTGLGVGVGVGVTSWLNWIEFLNRGKWRCRDKESFAALHSKPVRQRRF